MAKRPDVDLADWPSENPDEAPLGDEVIVTSAREGLTQFTEEPPIFAVAIPPPPPPVPAARVPASRPVLVTPAARHFQRRWVGLAGLTGVTLVLLITGGLTWNAARRRTAAATAPRATVTAPAVVDRAAAAPPPTIPAPAQPASDAPVAGGNLASRPPDPVAPPSPVVDRPVVRKAAAPIAKPVTGKPARAEKAPPQTRAASSPSGRAGISNPQPPPPVPKSDLPSARALPALNDPVGRPPAAAPPPATISPPVTEAVTRAAAETTPPTPPPTPPPAPATPTPAPPAPAAPVTETAAVESVLARYRDAFNTLDVNKTGMFWPNAPTEALGRAFDQLETQEFTFDQCLVSVTETTATATCRGRAAYTPKVGSRTLRVEARRWTFRLEKMNGIWVINRVDSTRGGD